MTSLDDEQSEAEMKAETVVSSSDVGGLGDGFFTTLFGPELKLPHFTIAEVMIRQQTDMDADCPDIGKRIDGYEKLLDSAELHRYLVYLSWLSDLHRCLKDDALDKKKKEFLKKACARENITRDNKHVQIAHRMLVAHYITSREEQEKRALMKRLNIAMFMLADLAVDVVRSTYLMDRVFLYLHRRALDAFNGTTTERLHALGQKIKNTDVIHSWSWDQDGLMINILHHRYHDYTTDEELKQREEDVKRVHDWKPVAWRVDDLTGQECKYHWQPKVEELGKSLAKLDVYEMNRKDNSTWTVTFSDKAKTKMDIAEQWIIDSGFLLWKTALDEAKAEEVKVNEQQKEQKQRDEPSPMQQTKMQRELERTKQQLEDVRRELDEAKKELVEERRKKRKQRDPDPSTVDAIVKKRIEECVKDPEERQQLLVKLRLSRAPHRERGEQQQKRSAEVEQSSL